MSQSSTRYLCYIIKYNNFKTSVLYFSLWQVGKSATIPITVKLQFSSPNCKTYYPRIKVYMGRHTSRARTRNTISIWRYFFFIHSFDHSHNHRSFITHTRHRNSVPSGVFLFKMNSCITIYYLVTKHEWVNLLFAGHPNIGPFCWSVAIRLRWVLYRHLHTLR